MTGLKIISGGQTGVDRAALDAARILGLPYGGFVPKGRWTEDGPLPQDYENMVETEGRNPASRTRRNVLAADATLVITRGGCEGGTLLTADKARLWDKPLLVVDLENTTPGVCVSTIRAWISETVPDILNVAGPRHSKDPAIYGESKDILVSALGGPSPG